MLSSQTPVLQQYYMPSNTDTLVTTLRKWVAKHGGQVPGQAASAAELPAELAREAALDRYHQHTVECRDCQQVRAGWCCCWCMLAGDACLVQLDGVAGAAGRIRAAGGGCMQDFVALPALEAGDGQTCLRHRYLVSLGWQ